MNVRTLVWTTVERFNNAQGKESQMGLPCVRKHCPRGLESRAHVRPLQTTIASESMLLTSLAEDREFTLLPAGFVDITFGRHGRDKGELYVATEKRLNGGWVTAVADYVRVCCRALSSRS